MKNTKSHEQKEKQKERFKKKELSKCRAFFLL